VKRTQPACVHDLRARRQDHFDSPWWAIPRGRGRHDPAKALLEDGLSLWRELRTDAPCECRVVHPRLMADIHAADQLSTCLCYLPNDDDILHVRGEILVNFVWF
jgi:hypothetical protein